MYTDTLFCIFIKFDNVNFTFHYVQVSWVSLVFQKSGSKVPGLWQDVKSTGIHSEGGAIYFQMHIGNAIHLHVGYTALPVKNLNLNGMGRRVWLKMSGQTRTSFFKRENADITLRKEMVDISVLLGCFYTGTFAFMHSMRFQKSLPFTRIRFIWRVCSHENAGNAVVHMPGL